MDLFDVRKQLREGLTLDNLKLRVTSYSRVSTDHEEQKKSLLNQHEHFEEIIKNNNNWQYVLGYIDEGISGTSDKKRDNFRKMINDAKAGKFDLIITKEISRFSRNTLDSIKYTRELLDYGVAVYFVNDNINTIMPDSELRLTIMASLAQDEVRRLSERVKFGMIRSIKKEVILGNNSILGYIKDYKTGKLIINDTEAMIVKEIYKMYVVDKLSLNKIADVLNKKRKIRKWKAIGIERIITNPKYKGYYCGKKTEVVDYITKKVKILPMNEWIIYKETSKIPKIVDEELWEMANKRLKLRKRNTKMNTSYENNYLFSGKILCVTDQTRYQRRKQCKANNEVTWLCANYLKNGKQSCNTANIRESELLMIFEQIIKYLELDKGIKFLEDLYYQKVKNNSKWQKIDKEKSVDNILNKLVDLYLEGNINKEEYLIRRKKYENILNKKKENKVILRSNLLEMIRTIMATNEIRFRIIQIILKRIEVKKTDYGIDMQIILNLSNYLINKIKTIFNGTTFSFKRGIYSNSTKRYVINYMVYLDNK